MTLNEMQQKIADKLDGMIVVDAGPGTGKTFTVVARCLNILMKDDVKPDDLVMLTFTNNAAAEMRERVQKAIAGMYNDKKIDDNGYKNLSSKAKQAYIGTFDSFCLSVVKQSPDGIRKFFGIDDSLTRSATITDNDSLNEAYFGRFIDRFLSQRAGEFGDIASLIAEYPSQTYSLINSLMSRGIIPIKRTPSGRCGWFGGNEGGDLYGDTKLIRDMLNNFGGLDGDGAKKFTDHPISKKYDLRSKTPVPEMLDEVAFDDRSALIDMIHEIYYDYVCRCITDDHLTFGLVACFAYVVLLTDEKAREKVMTKYLIVDEFQDTNSNQLMICLLLLKEPNLCVVGDWKQGIYGFRYVSIENITQFEKKAVEVRRFLNDNGAPVRFHIPETVLLPLVENYRSSQLIIDKAFETLETPGTKSEVINSELLGKVTKIKSMRTDIGNHTGFETVRCESPEAEIDETLRTIDRYVNSGKYFVQPDTREGETPKPAIRPRYKDIAILCRKNPTARQIYEACLKHGIPAFLQGEVSIMSTREGKLLLAWLRYISNDKDPWGISTILADMNYPCNEIKWMTTYDKDAGCDHVPEELKTFKKHLRGKRRRITELISSIYAYYGLDNDVTQAIISILSGNHRGTLQTISDLINTIEDDIAKDNRYDVDGLPDSNAVTIQTMHKSKGLEYPIVIIPRIDSKSFPSAAQSRKVFEFNELTGIRNKKELIYFGNEKKIGDSWKYEVMKNCLTTNYDEERRLFFVAISRAKQYVTLISGNSPSTFFEHFTDDYTRTGGTTEVPVFHLESDALIPKPEIPALPPRRKLLAVHDLMHMRPYGSVSVPGADVDEKRGKIFGTEIHGYIEMMVKGLDVDPKLLVEYPQLAHAKKVLDGLRSEGAVLRAEVECRLPLEHANATISGTIDLIAEFPDRVEIHDWKTDVEPDNEEEYKFQLSCYALVLRHLTGKDTVCFIQWLTLEKDTQFDPKELGEIEERAKAFLNTQRSL